MAGRIKSARGMRAWGVVVGLALVGASAIAAAQTAQQPAQPAPAQDQLPPARAAAQDNAAPPRAAAPAWDAAKSAAAQPVWPVSALPAAVTPLPAERLSALQLGMATDAVQGALGAPHSNLKAEGGIGEVWQYVVSERAANRAYIVSLWFDRKGLWMASGQSRPVGRLSEVGFGGAAPAVAAPAVAAAPAASAPPPAPVTPPPAAAPSPAAAVPAPPPSAAAAAPAPAAAAPAPAEPVSALAPAGATPAGDAAAPLVVYPAAKRAAPAVMAAAGAPADAAPAPVAAAADETPALKQLLERWLADWNGRDAAAYVTHYAPDYALAGKPRAQWESERRQRMESTRFIRVSAENVEVRNAATARPQLAFIQNYESDRYKERSRKVLTLMKVDGRWMIVREENTTLSR